MAPAASVFSGIALAHGLAIAIMVRASGINLGGHFNPAVTIGFWVTKAREYRGHHSLLGRAACGATAAAFLLKAVVPEDTWRAVRSGTPELARDFPRWREWLSKQ